MSLLTALPKPHVRLKMSCSSPPELVLWTGSVLTAAEKEDMCGWCGQTGALPPPEEGEATLPLPPRLSAAMRRAARAKARARLLRR